ncbi:DUF688 family protein [Quillaja saponaria]|uniref:DUF688 family protein n=1 Tax=Quillaja saponaria TaxID=32244 RepID=A0AAD7VFH8_QUISA|nr:DUF688 family protein [Quillaja saponaria]
MESSASDKIVGRKCDIISPTMKYMNPAASRRTPSFSSSSSSSLSYSSSSYFLDDSPLSPSTPLQFSGVPFSWEHLPGIPKKQNSKKLKESSLKLLPLPPPTAHIQTSKRFNLDQETAIRKKNSREISFQKDPFFAALVECSKDDDDDEEITSNSNLWNEAKVTRSLSDRFGFISLYASCKRTCAISESIIHLPNPSSRRSTGTYNHLNRRSSR